MTYRRKFSTTFWGIKTVKEFEQMSGLQSYDFQSEFEQCKIVVQNPSLEHQSFVNLLQSCFNSQLCQNCKCPFVKGFTKIKATCFIQICCKQTVQHLKQKRLFYENKPLNVHFELKQASQQPLNLVQFSIEDYLNQQFTLEGEFTQSLHFKHIQELQQLKILNFKLKTYELEDTPLIGEIYLFKTTQEASFDPEQFGTISTQINDFVTLVRNICSLYSKYTTKEVVEEPSYCFKVLFDWTCPEIIQIVVKFSHETNLILNENKFDLFKFDSELLEFKQINGQRVKKYKYAVIGADVNSQEYIESVANLIFTSFNATEVQVKLQKPHQYGKFSITNDQFEVKCEMPGQILKQEPEDNETGYFLFNSYDSIACGEYEIGSTVVQVVEIV
ncbi:Hypothetical_protein [Hexamita inflata]|uniref:Hypothetical_protein n=1 Tax=Hexamita inflata TaxID=28002 RepID=A0AA86VBG6_9EUKA|nr:Hypothetical protein HINF_LOCUS49698 [Hexamita inflata]